MKKRFLVYLFSPRTPFGLSVFPFPACRSCSRRREPCPSLFCEPRATVSFALLMTLFTFLFLPIVCLLFSFFVVSFRDFSSFLGMIHTALDSSSTLLLNHTGGWGARTPQLRSRKWSRRAGSLQSPLRNVCANSCPVPPLFFFCHKQWSPPHFFLIPTLQGLSYCSPLVD